MHCMLLLWKHRGGCVSFLTLDIICLNRMTHVCLSRPLFCVLLCVSHVSCFVLIVPCSVYSVRVSLSLLSFSVVTPSHIAVCSPLFLVFSSFLPSSLSWFLFLFLVPCSQFPVLGFVFMYLVSSLAFWSNSYLLHSISLHPYHIHRLKIKN